MSSSTSSDDIPGHSSRSGDGLDLWHRYDYRSSGDESSSDSGSDKKKDVPEKPSHRPGQEFLTVPPMVTKKSSIRRPTALKPAEKTVRLFRPESERESELIRERIRISDKLLGNLKRRSTFPAYREDVREELSPRRVRTATLAKAPSKDVSEITVPVPKLKRGMKEKLEAEVEKAVRFQVEDGEDLKTEVEGDEDVVEDLQGLVDYMEALEIETDRFNKTLKKVKHDHTNDDFRKLERYFKAEDFKKIAFPKKPKWQFPKSQWYSQVTVPEWKQRSWYIKDDLPEIPRGIGPDNIIRLMDFSLIDDRECMFQVIRHMYNKYVRPIPPKEALHVQGARETLHERPEKKHPIDYSKFCSLKPCRRIPPHPPVCDYFPWYLTAKQLKKFKEENGQFCQICLKNRDNIKKYIYSVTMDPDIARKKEMDLIPTYAAVNQFRYKNFHDEYKQLQRLDAHVSKHVHGLKGELGPGFMVKTIEFNDKLKLMKTIKKWRDTGLY